MHLRLDKERTFGVLVWLSDLEGLEDEPPAVLESRLGERGFLVEGLEELLEELRRPVPEAVLERLERELGEEAAARARRLVR